MFQSRTRNDRRIFFPWEGRGGLRRFFAKGRFGPVILLIGLVCVISLMFSRERHQSGLRRTYVALSLVNPAVQRYLLENEGECPPELSDVLPYLERTELPGDAWGRPLRLVCPSVREGVSYVLLSDGPDGLPGGLDRVEF